MNTKKRREVEQLFLAEGRALIQESTTPPVRLFEAEEDVRRVSALTTPTGPVGVFPFLDVSVEDLLSAMDRVAVLHGVQDPGNVGTIIRSAHAFGAGVVLSAGCADLYNPKTVRATMGSLFRVPIAREVDTVEFLAAAGLAGLESVAAVPRGGDSARQTLGRRCAIVVGTEGAGLPEEVVEACRRRVSVPSRAASLNAAIAASILLYEAFSPVLP